MLKKFIAICLVTVSLLSAIPANAYNEQALVKKANAMRYTGSTFEVPKGWGNKVSYYNASDSFVLSQEFQKRADMARWIVEKTIVTPQNATGAVAFPIYGMILMGGQSFRLHQDIAQNYANTCVKGSKKFGVAVYSNCNLINKIVLQKVSDIYDK